MILAFGFQLQWENLSRRCNIIRFKIGSARFAMQQITFIASGTQSGNPMNGESLIRETNVITYFCRQVINNVSIWPFTNFSAFGWYRTLAILLVYYALDSFFFPHSREKDPHVECSFSLLQMITVLQLV